MNINYKLHQYYSRIEYYHLFDNLYYPRNQIETISYWRKKMSIKKEILGELTEQQLKELAESKGIKFDLSEAKKKYYAGWEEKDKLVDIMNDKENLTVKDIEEYLKISKNKQLP